MAVFETGSIEQQLVDIAGIKPGLLGFKRAGFSMEIKDEELLFHLDESVSTEAYCSDLIESSEACTVSYMDIILSPLNGDSFSYGYNASAKSTNPTFYEENNSNVQLDIVLAIAYGFLTSKFKGLENMEDIDRPIPSQLFMNILNKQKNLDVLYVNRDGLEFAGTLRRAQIVSNIFSTFFQLEIAIISKGKDGFVEGSTYFNLPFQSLLEKISDMGIEELTEEKKRELTLRGTKYVQYTENPTYCVYDGFAHRYGGHMGDIRSKVTGRVMIDIGAMRAMNAEVGDQWYIGNPFNRNGGGHTAAPSVNEDSLWKCSPVVFGFSFNTKEWVRMEIQHISDIVFSETVFDELILHPAHKNILLSCLQTDMPSLDSIEGKGKGSIFLLYGPPGVGKTMTAEAVAEHLRKPLYFVSVGELGISPESMEKNLSAIMNVATSWEAVVLLDEVDVFAMKRIGSDIQRNAMTAILLRLLERYSGTMFMTTNLLDNLDDAFKSRATALIPYTELSVSDRTSIWQSMLRKVGCLGVNVDNHVYDSIISLAEYNLNGREIKNHVRVAYSVAMCEKNKTITMNSLLDLISLRTA
jgi:AAA+ superfamily predicted ATPase